MLRQVTVLEDLPQSSSSLPSQTISLEVAPLQPEAPHIEDPCFLIRSHISLRTAGGNGSGQPKGEKINWPTTQADVYPLLQSG